MTLRAVGLRNLTGFPVITMGLMQISEADVIAAVHQAVAVSYRSFVTAPVYGNKAAVGAVLRSAPANRRSWRGTARSCRSGWRYGADA